MGAIVLAPAGVRAVCYPGFTPRTLDVVQQYRPGALAESGERWDGVGEAELAADDVRVLQTPVIIAYRTPLMEQVDFHASFRWQTCTTKPDTANLTSKRYILSMLKVRINNNHVKQAKVNKHKDKQKTIMKHVLQAKKIQINQHHTDYNYSNSSTMHRVPIENKLKQEYTQMEQKPMATQNKLCLSGGLQMTIIIIATPTSWGTWLINKSIKKL